MAEALFDLASAIQRERGSDTAMLFVRLALALDPSLAFTLLAAEILDDQEQDQVALDLARSVGLDSPYWVMAQLRIAGSLEALDRRDEAISGLEALAASRSDLQARWSASATLSGAGKPGMRRLSLMIARSSV